MIWLGDWVGQTQWRNLNLKNATASFLKSQQSPPVLSGALVTSRPEDKIARSSPDSKLKNYLKRLYYKYDIEIYKKTF